KVRDAPEGLAPGDDQMPAKVREPWTASAAMTVRSIVFSIFRQQRSPHLNVIQKRYFAGLTPRMIEALEPVPTLRKSRASRQQKEERQQRGNVQGNRAQCVPPNGLPL